MILVENSMLTPRQVSIIYKRLGKAKSLDDVSNGAYYRQVKQCKRKVRRILYTIILLKLIGVLDDQIYTILDQVSAQLDQISIIREQEVSISQEIDRSNLIPLLESVIAKLTKM
ncbi:MAG: hypothetical protein M3P08_14190 [Thermoproteota archaeon]|nr:hypothetical protein [Thermoproteota archaeon]